MHTIRITWWSVKTILKRRTKLVLTGVFLLGIVWFMFSTRTATIRKGVNPFSNQPCSNDESLEVIQSICSSYKKGDIVGDLCEPLCSQHQVEFVQCLNYRNGKHVIQVNCNEMCMPHATIPAVLKMTHSNISGLHNQLKQIDKDLLSRLQVQENIDKMDTNTYFITAESMSLLVQDILDSEYGFTPRENQDMLSILWNEDYGNHFKGPHTNLVFARSFWSVVHQNEYRISKTFSDWNVFPKIYGSCGPIYLSENAPGLTTFNKIYALFVPGYPSWKSRAKTAISILHLVHLMETMDDPLHLCNVKSPHFGITPDNNVKFIDADAVFADHSLHRDLGAQSCKKHADCAIFDCEGWCITESGKCSPERTNNNLQMVCAKIFRSSYLFNNYGLLASPPEEVAARIANLLNSCADDITDQSQDKIPLRRPDIGLITKLSEYLLESLKFDTDS